MTALQDYSRRDFLKGMSMATGAGVVSSLAPLTLSAQSATPATSAAKTQLPQFAGFGQPAEDTEAFWAKVRSQFPLDPELTFLNNGTLGPAPGFVVETREHYNQLLARDPCDCFRMKELAEVRAALASALHAAEGEITITHSTTEGMNIFAHGLDWKPGDEVIMGDQEHFAAFEPYQALAQRFGIKVVTVKLPVPAVEVDQVVAAYAKAFTPRTRVLVVSHVSYVSGLVAPLRELADLAHSHGALVSVDGAQSFGVLPVDVAATGIDHFAASGQKWLLAGTGTGVSYIRKELQPKIWPLFGYDDPVKPNSPSPRYERSGQLGIPAASGIAAALQFRNAVGPDLIEARARRLGAQVRQAVLAIPGAKLISSVNSSLSANINVFTLPNLAPDKVATALSEQQRIVIRALSHGDINALRVSTHFYNSSAQVDRLFSILSSWSKDPPQSLAPAGKAS